MHDRTPDCVVFFLAGSLPATALLHKRMLSLFYMIARLPENILHRIGKYVLTTFRPSSKSWFVKIRALCILYNLPHPLQTLNNPPPKETGKSLIKSRIISHWETNLRDSAKNLSSLSYFHPEFMSLLQPHPLYSTCGDNSFEVSKALVQARMLSGRYRTDKLLTC